MCAVSACVTTENKEITWITFKLIEVKIEMIQKNTYSIKKYQENFSVGETDRQHKTKRQI